MSLWESSPCPICFEDVGNHWSTHKAWYHTVDNHSWDNHTCDCHEICWSCLAQHIETQVLSEGKCSIRCPGIGCHYLLLRQDVEYAMWGSRAGNQVLEALSHMSSQSCQDRLKKMVFGKVSDESAQWLLGECQPCPKCFVLSRRETGCNHIVCRCGCDFCFGCGAPSTSACLCDSLLPDIGSTRVFFAAWLRVAHESPCDWLWESIDREEGPASLMQTLGFWLWIAGAEIPIVWQEAEKEQKTQSVLPPLHWKRPNDDYWMSSSDGIDEFAFDSDYEDNEELWERQDLAGHLRKEAYSYQSQRSLRRRSLQLKHSRRRGSETSGDQDVPSEKPNANRTLY